MPEIDDPFYTGIISGIEQVAVTHDYDIFVGSFNQAPQRERKLFDAFEEKRLAGVVIAGTVVDDAYLNSGRRTLPAVLVSQPGYPFAVDIDQEEGVFLAIKHLADHGHRHIAFIGLSTDSASQRRRLQGYRAALKRCALAFRPRLVESGDGGIQSGVQAMQRLLNLPKAPTAVFCYNDRTAIGAIHTVHSAGLQVPEHVSVVGFDDLEIAAYVNPPLTTVRQPHIELGRRAARMLFAQLNQETAASQTLAPELIIRNSTDPLRGPFQGSIICQVKMEKSASQLSASATALQPLVQGVQYYNDAPEGTEIPGLMHASIGGYHISDIEFSARNRRRRYQSRSGSQRSNRCAPQQHD